MSEADTQRRAVAALRAAGWFVTVTASDKRGRRQHSGLPDAIAVRRNRVLFVEFKSPTGQRRESQERWWLALYPHTGPNVEYLVCDDVRQLAAWIDRESQP